MTTTILGKVRPTFRGPYDNTVQYVYYDVVDFEGSSYIAKEDVMGVLPTDATKWQLNASKGTDSTGTSDLILEDYSPVNPPVLSLPLSINFTGSQQITMTTDRTADIYYTLDNSIPTTYSSKYTAPITITRTTRVKAFAVDSLGNKSDIVVTSYLDLNYTTNPVLTMTPSGNFTGTKEVTLSLDRTGVIYYTLDGSTPTEESTHYNGKPIVLNATTTVKAFGKDPTYCVSPVQSQTYTKVG